MQRLVLISTLTVLVWGNNATAADPVLGFENATVQPNGPRSGDNGQLFFNIEGADNGGFASYGVVRFMVDEVKDQFDREFGVAAWSIDTVELILTQANASFTKDGMAEILFTEDDDVSIVPGDSPLTYPLDDDFPDAQSILTYEFEQTFDGDQGIHTLYDASGQNSDGGIALANDLFEDDVVTLLVVEAEPMVAATYAGITNVGFEGPTLNVTAMAGPPPAALQAGDANQDLKFDQIDLVQVQVANKYLSGQTASWGEGDWNGAPGGSVGNPPAGNGRFDQLDIVAAQIAGIYLTGPYAAVKGGGQTGDEQTSIGYDPSTGEVWVDAPASTELTSINIDSASAIFTGAAAQNLGGSFDNDADNNIFKATFGSSFGSLTFGNVAQPGLEASFLLNDLTVIGSLNGGGDLGEVDLIYVPEPATLLLFALSSLMLVCHAPKHALQLLQCFVRGNRC